MSLRDNTDQYEALLELRNTPRQGTGQSPAKMMFGRATQSFLPAISNTKSERARNAAQKRARHRLQVKQSYDKGARDLKQLSPGQPVYYQHTEGKKYDWRRGKVRAKHSERSYIIEGKIYIEETEFIYVPRQVKSTKITVKTTREKQTYKQDHNEQDKSPTGRKTIQYVKVLLLY